MTCGTLTADVRAETRNTSGMKLTCPNCGPSAKCDFFTKRSGHTLVRCSSCGLVYLNLADDSIAPNFFDDAEQLPNRGRQHKDRIQYWSYPELFEKHRSVFLRFFEDRWNKIQSIGRDVQSLLDIGCGYGFFVEYMMNRIPLVRGIDLNPRVIEYAREEKSLPVEKVTVEDYDPDRSFDCITMCDVLEHVIHPADVLLGCRKLLKAGGVLFIQVPSLLGFKLPWGHSWGLPHHLWQFSPKTLSLLLKRTGFHMAQWHTGVLGVVGSYEKGGPSALERLQWALARSLKIGNRLQIIALKDEADDSGK